MEIGNIYELKITVGEHDLASYMGSGSEDVLATPMMICWMEQASVECLNLRYEGMCSLGIKVDIEHIAPTPLGGQVRVTSKLIRIEGKKYTFEVTAYDQIERIGFGLHERVITKTDRFMDKARAKLK